MKVELNREECDLLTQLMGTSKDDPRIHGLIGTCFHKVMISFVFCSLMVDWDRLVG